VTSQRVDARKVDADCLLPWIRERAAAFPEDSRDYLEELTLAFLDSHSRSLQADELYDAIGVLDNVAFDFVVDLWHHLLEAQVTAVALSTSARGHESSQAQFIPGVPTHIEAAAKLFLQAPGASESQRPQPPREKDLDHGAKPSDLESLDRSEHQSLQESNLDHGNNPSASKLHAELASNCKVSRDPDADLGHAKGTGCGALPHANANPSPCETAPIVVGISEVHHIVGNESKSNGQAASQSHRAGEDRALLSDLDDSRGRTATRKRSRFSRDQRHVSPSRGHKEVLDVRWGRGLEADRPADVDWGMERRSRGEASLETKAKLSCQGARKDDKDYEKHPDRKWDSGSRDMEHAGGNSLGRNGSGYEGRGNNDYRAYRHRDDRRSEGVLKPRQSEGDSGRQRDGSRRRDCTYEVISYAKHDGYPSPYSRDDRRASESRRRKSQELTGDDSRSNQNGYFGHARDSLRSGPRYKSPREIGDCRREGFGNRRRLDCDRLRGRTRRGNSSPAAHDFDHIPPLPKKRRKSLECNEEFLHSSASKDDSIRHGESQREHGLMITNSPPDRRGLLSSNRLVGANAELSGDGAKKNEDLPVLKLHSSPKGLGRLSSSPLPIASRRESSDFKDSSDTTHMVKHACSRTLQRVGSASDRLEAMKKTLLLKLKVQRSLGMRKSSRKLKDAGDI
jgi:hypothetical protein